MDAEVQDGQDPTGRGLEGVIYFQRPKARAKVVKKSIYTNKKHPKTCICAKFLLPLQSILVCASMRSRSRSAISLMGPIGQIGLIGRREDAEVQDGQGLQN